MSASLQGDRQPDPEQNPERPSNPGGAEKPESPSLDRIVHEPARLRILASLFIVREADVTWLRNQTGLTWGNLSSHMSKLEEAGYVEVQKEFIDRKPCTLMKLTDEGRVAFEQYRSTMLGLLGT